MAFKAFHLFFALCSVQFFLMYHATFQSLILNDEKEIFKKWLVAAKIDWGGRQQIWQQKRAEGKIVSKLK